MNKIGCEICGDLDCLRADTNNRFYLKCKNNKSSNQLITINIFKNKGDEYFGSYIELIIANLYICMQINETSIYISEKNIEYKKVNFGIKDFDYIENINIDNYYEIFGDILIVINRYLINSVLE